MPVYPILVRATAPSAAVPARGVVCFSGFRNSELEKKLESMGFTVTATLTKKTTVLVIPDGEVNESTKVVKARESGIPVRSCADFLVEYKVQG